MQPTQILFLLVIVAAFYFLLIRPQQQQAKRQLEMVAGLEPGDEIVTVGGIHATVVSFAGDRIRVAVADGSQLEIAKRAVSAVVTSAPEADAEEDDDLAEEPPTEDASETVVDEPEGESPDA